MRMLIGLALILVAAGCDSEEKKLCKHMLELAKKSGEADDTADIDKCVEAMKKGKEEVGEEKFAAFTECVLARDTLKAAMTECDPEKGELEKGESGAMGEYVAKSKGTEAKVFVKRLYDGARAYYLDPQVGSAGLTAAEPQLPAPSVGPTPAVGSCCESDDKKCPVDASQWEDPVWTALMFSVDDPHYYSYEYRVDDDKKGFTVSAYGDLDCDGTISTFRLSGKVDAAGSVAPPGEVETHNELE